MRPAQNKRVPWLCSPRCTPAIVEAFKAQRMEQVPALAAHPHGHVPASDPAEPSAMRLLRARPLGTSRRSVRAVALPAPAGASLGLRLGSWLLRLLRECVYLLLCSWCIHELLD